jgi:signal transduction histidine kinase
VDKTKILIVDDLEGNLIALQALLKDSLSKSDDLEIFKAISGTQALGLLLDHDFALAMIDVQMPGMDGFELGELMRGAEKTKHVPIIFVTAGARDSRHTFKGYESGAVDFLYKPIDPQIVRSKVQIFVELDQQKRLLKDQLAQMKQKETELQKALAIRDEFLGIASHELRTPLTSLKLHLQMISRNVKKQGLQSIAPARFEKMLDTANRQVENLTKLISDLMDVSRIAGGKLILEPEEMDLVVMLQEVAEYFSEHLATAECRLVLRAPEPLIGLWDRQRVQQVVVNLISNALKYGPGAPIEVEAVRSGGIARLSVRDGGIGIAIEDQERIFERFERAVHGKDSVSGLGLGLFIVKQIVVALGGCIEVESKLGRGSTFTVELPLKGVGTSKKSRSSQQA